ncbi:hypothetical protein JKP88DRAFT_265963 [Tribonema minus]|uniref:Uncharacterized protein n=1 Tax=Tribonema minus TaxID=303371 RepID=A0A835YQ22_9STRA|nr:hypothetical protein JKP88DRAFT_265963 [Tribonema minus]
MTRAAAAGGGSSSSASTEELQTMEDTLKYARDDAKRIRCRLERYGEEAKFLGMRGDLLRQHLHALTVNIGKMLDERARLQSSQPLVNTGPHAPEDVLMTKAKLCVGLVSANGQCAGTVVRVAKNGLCVSAAHIFIQNEEFLEMEAWGTPLKLVASFPAEDLIFVQGEPGPCIDLAHTRGALWTKMKLTVLAFPVPPFIDLNDDVAHEHPLASSGELSGITITQRAALAKYSPELPPSPGGAVFDEEYRFLGIHLGTTYHHEHTHWPADEDEMEAKPMTMDLPGKGFWPYQTKTELEEECNNEECDKDKQVEMKEHGEGEDTELEEGQDSGKGKQEESGLEGDLAPPSPINAETAVVALNRAMDAQCNTSQRHQLAFFVPLGQIVRSAMMAGLFKKSPYERIGVAYSKRGVVPQRPHAKRPKHI